jgi:raffinose/stachyose/melibiose transport system substrate-binding protein
MTHCTKIGPILTYVSGIVSDPVSTGMAAIGGAITLDRRHLLKRTGTLVAGAALAGGIPAVSTILGSVSAQDTEFDVWTTYTDPIRVDLIESIGSDFGDANGVKFAHRGWQLEELGNTLPRSVDSNQGPDVSQVNNGESLAGPMARAGQILTLKDYDTQYGWSTRFAPSLLARCSYSADGKTFGEGELWGLPAESEIVGFYYNKQIFSDNGLPIPATFAELEDAFATLKGAGVTPLVFGNLDKWPAIHMYGAIQGTNTTREYLDGLIYRRGDADFTDPSIVDAAAKLAEWKESGYLLDGFEGISADDAQALFTGSGGAILMQGSWAAGAVRDGLGGNAGFFTMPAASSDAKVLNVGGVGIPYSITKNAGDPALAATFIDTLVSEDSFSKFVDAGQLPLGTIGEDKITTDTVTGDLYKAWNAALADDAIGHYLDWAAPQFYDVLTGALQELLGGKATPEEFAAKLQDFYAASFS